MTAVAMVLIHVLLHSRKSYVTWVQQQFVFRSFKGKSVFWTAVLPQGCIEMVVGVSHVLYGSESSRRSMYSR